MLEAWLQFCSRVDMAKDWQETRGKRLTREENQRMWPLLTDYSKTVPTSKFETGRVPSSMLCGTSCLRAWCRAPPSTSDTFAIRAILCCLSARTKS